MRTPTGRAVQSRCSVGVALEEVFAHMSATKQAPRRLSEEERYRRLETRTLNRVKDWDAKAGRRRHDVVELLKDSIEMLEAFAPDGKPPQDPSARRVYFKYRHQMYGLWAELEAIRVREAASS